MGAKEDKLILKLNSTISHEDKSIIRQKLFELGSKAVPALSKSTKSQSSVIRWEAVNLLGQIADPGGQKSVINVVLTEDDVHARWRAIWASSRFDRNSTVKLLLNALRSKNKIRKWNAAIALSLYANQKSLPVLIEGLKSKDEWKTWEALNCLKSLSPVGYENKIGKFLDKKYSRQLRQEAVLTLGNIPSKKSQNLLNKAIKDYEPEVRWRASMSLIKFTNDKALATIDKAIKNEKQLEIKLQLKKDYEYLRRILNGSKNRKKKTQRQP